MTTILSGKTILVTGGTGSMGKQFVKRALADAKKVIVFSRDEAKQYEMKMSGDYPGVEFRLGDMRRIADIISALPGVDIVVNAAALKQVPSCEYFPEQAVLTNCLGTANLIRAVKETGAVDTVVTISTDKACQPTNVMGMTKAIQERMIVAANIGDSHTRFIGVRYGNVIGSRGSVIPLFLEQIARGGPITITDLSMTRFLITLNQAVDIVIAAIDEANPGEIYVPDAPATSVFALAVMLLGPHKIPIKTVGSRPGEKQHEIMISKEELVQRRGKYYAVLPALAELKWVTEAHRMELNSQSCLISHDQLRALLTATGFLS
jgi:FlaA1/EpsC-like NDP-sugar epimerase